MNKSPRVTYIYDTIRKLVQTRRYVRINIEGRREEKALFLLRSLILMYPDVTPQNQEDLNFWDKVGGRTPQISSALEMIEASRQSDLLGHSFRVAAHAIRIG